MSRERHDSSTGIPSAKHHVVSAEVEDINGTWINQWHSFDLDVFRDRAMALPDTWIVQSELHDLHLGLDEC